MVLLYSAVMFQKISYILWAVRIFRELVEQFLVLYILFLGCAGLKIMIDENFTFNGCFLIALWIKEMCFTPCRGFYGENYFIEFQIILSKIEKLWN